MQKLIKLDRIDTHNNCFFIDKFLMQHIHCHVKCSSTCSFTGTALQHIKGAFLNCEFYVKHIVEGLFKDVTDIPKFFVCARHSLLHTVKMLVLIIFCIIVERARGTDTCNNILTLCIYKPLTVKQVFTCCRVAGKCNTGCRCVTHVSEYHRLYVNSSSPVIWNTFNTTV